MGARKKAAGRKPARKKAAAGKARSGERKARARQARPKAAARRRKVPTIETVARRIVKAARDFQSVDIDDLYAPEAVSQEPGQPPTEGVAAILQKAEGFESQVESASWSVRNQWIKGNTVAIEWDADIQFKNGQKVAFQEIAVHEVRGGKIVAERYYYDPTPFQAALAPARDPDAERLPPLEPEAPAGPSSPPPDPMDL